MGFGDTAKKLQKITSAAEDLYAKMGEVRDQLSQLREEVETTSRQVDGMAADLAEQRAIVEALAEAQDLDIEAVLEQADTTVEATEDEEAEEAKETEATEAVSDAAPEE